jgi:hypothetical protein
MMTSSSSVSWLAEDADGAAVAGAASVAATSGGATSLAGASAKAVAATTPTARNSSQIPIDVGLRLRTLSLRCHLKHGLLRCLLSSDTKEKKSLTPVLDFRFLSLHVIIFCDEVNRKIRAQGDP